MGIERIKLGPKSRIPKQVQDAVDEVLSKADPGDYIEAVARSIGCACGSQQVSDRDKPFVDAQSTVHRYGNPCYRVQDIEAGGSKQAGLPAAGAATPEPPPKAGRSVVLDDLVVALRERSAFGERKYGTKLQTFNGRDAHLDALQELLDLFVYLHQAAMERAALEAELEQLRAQKKCCGKGGC